ncbi:MAG: M24 family metallopeptidase [Opitutia bacterium]
MARPSAPAVRDILLMATPSKNADLRWFGGFHASDPFPAFSVGRRRIGLLPGMEVGRAQEESAFDEVLNLTAIIADLRKTNPQAGVADAIVFAALRRGVQRFRVPADFPVGLYERLRELGLALHPVGAQQNERGAPEVFPQRLVKSQAELAGIRAGNAAAAAGFKAVEQVLAESQADKKGVLRWKGRTLTAEILKEEAQVAILRRGGLCDIGLIIAPGDQAVDCHCSGSGPVRANELIVCDIYPRHVASRQYGDMTRTYLKGKANARQRKMVLAVLEAQRRAIKAIKAGVTGAKVHAVVQGYFKSLGYVTGLKKGVYVGFFHGTGHGLGLDIHEDPALSTRNPQPLVVGNAVTVEPGLYYPGLGGCRFEDCVVVTKQGCEFLSAHPYDWEIA